MGLYGLVKFVPSGHLYLKIRRAGGGVDSVTPKRQRHRQTDRQTDRPRTETDRYPQTGEQQTERQTVFKKRGE